MILTYVFVIFMIVYFMVLITALKDIKRKSLIEHFTDRFVTIYDDESKSSAGT